MCVCASMFVLSVSPCVLMHACTPACMTVLYISSFEHTHAITCSYRWHWCQTFCWTPLPPDCLSSVHPAVVYLQANVACKLQWLCMWKITQRMSYVKLWHTTNKKKSQLLESKRFFGSGWGGEGYFWKYAETCSLIIDAISGQPHMQASYQIHGCTHKYVTLYNSDNWLHPQEN